MQATSLEAIERRLADAANEHRNTGLLALNTKSFKAAIIARMPDNKANAIDIIFDSPVKKRALQRKFAEKLIKYQDFQQAKKVFKGFFSKSGAFNTQRFRSRKARQTEWWLRSGQILNKSCFESAEVFSSKAIAPAAPSKAGMFDKKAHEREPGSELSPPRSPSSVIGNEPGMTAR